MSNIVAVMPIKINNERLPGKNTKKLGDKPLIHYELETLSEIDEIKKIYVYCSDSAINEFLLPSVQFLRRPKFLDQPTSNFTQIFESFINTIDAEIYVYAHATAPFVKIETVKDCIDAVLNRGYDSAFCASKIQDYLWSNNKPLNFDAENLPRSQDLEPIYRETSGVYVLKKEVFQKYHRRIGINPYIKNVSIKEAVDINNPEDFELAKIMLNIDL